MNDAARRIADAWATGEAWAVIEAREGEDGFRRVELHVPTGVAVEWGAYRGEDGEVVYYTHSEFRNRRTGEELPCGSRRWNAGRFRSLAELHAAVERAKAEVPVRFAGIARIVERQRRRDGAPG